MLSHPTRIETATSSSRRAVCAARGSFLVAGAALVLIALGTRLGSPPVQGAPVAAAVSTSIVPSAPAVVPGTGCWVPGDLVGEGNPADVAAALCRQK